MELICRAAAQADLPACCNVFADSEIYERYFSAPGALEKHVPVIEVEGNKVTVRVGAVEHPMLPEHYIEWIALETAQGNQRKPLAPGQKPEAVFMLAEGDSVVAAYEYCNLHSLWKA